MSFIDKKRVRAVEYLEQNEFTFSLEAGWVPGPVLLPIFEAKPYLEKLGYEWKDSKWQPRKKYEVEEGITFDAIGNKRSPLAPPTAPAPAPAPTSTAPDLYRYSGNGKLATRTKLDYAALSMLILEIKAMYGPNGAVAAGSSVHLRQAIWQKLKDILP